MKNLFYMLSLVAFVMSGCMKDDNSDGNNPPVAIQLDSFPLTIGHSWKFHTEVRLSDSVGVVSQFDQFDNYWTVISDTLINGVPSSKIAQLDSNYDGTTHLAYSYYANKPEGFFGMAYLNMGSMFVLRSTSNAEVLLNSYLQFLAPANVDSLFIPDSSLWFLKFPTALNDTWHAVKYGTSGSYYQTRKYENYQTFTTSAGTFNCLKVKIYFEDNGQPDAGSPIFYQYFGTKGLIAETLFAQIVFADGSTRILNRTTKLVQVNF